MDIETFETLKERDLALPDGETCRFPASRRKLAAALTLLASPAPAVQSSRRLTAEAAQRNEAFKLARLEDADLAGVRAKWVPRDGDVFLEAGPLSTAQGVAMARFLLRLDHQP